MLTSADPITWMTSDFNWSRQAVDIVNEQVLEEHIPKNTFANPLPLWDLPWRASAAEIAKDQALEECTQKSAPADPLDASTIIEEQALEE